LVSNPAQRPAGSTARLNFQRYYGLIVDNLIGKQSELDARRKSKQDGAGAASGGAVAGSNEAVAPDPTIEPRLIGDPWITARGFPHQGITCHLKLRNLAAVANLRPKKNHNSPTSSRFMSPDIAREPRALPFRRMKAAAAFVAPLLVLLIIWQASVSIFGINPRVFPGIGAVWQAGVALVADGSLLQHISASLGRVAAGTSLAILLSVPLGIAMGVIRPVATFLTPLLRFFSVLAGIAWIPIATLWFGYGFGAITFVIFNAVFFVVTYNAMLGVASIPVPLRYAAASLGARRWRMLIEVLIPGALPNIVTGIRTGLGFAWRGLIAAEMIATNVGLGYMLFLARDFYRTEVIVLGMIVIGLLWLVLDRLLLAPLERATIERWGMVQRG
jgi:taurine transport system permease protein